MSPWHTYNTDILAVHRTAISQEGRNMGCIRHKAPSPKPNKIRSRSCVMDTGSADPRGDILASNTFSKPPPPIPVLATHVLPNFHYLLGMKEPGGRCPEERHGGKWRGVARRFSFLLLLLLPLDTTSPGGACL